MHNCVVLWSPAYEPSPVPRPASAVLPEFHRPNKVLTLAARQACILGFCIHVYIPFFNIVWAASKWLGHGEANSKQTLKYLVSSKGGKF